MVLDYSKWDSLELSDDSDIECHPNVDKKSFIRAKQNQIHQQRHERRLEIETLKYERIINDGLLERINGLLDALKKHQDSSKNPDELVFQALIESAGDPAKDEPPRAPDGVHSAQKEPMPKYSKMIGSLVDQVKKDVDEKKDPNRYQGFVDGVNSHLAKVQDLQKQLLAKLASLEKEQSSKITSDAIRTGFNTSHVSAPKSPPAKSEKVELLNPNASSDGSQKQQAANDDEDDDDSDLKTTPLAKKFAKIKLGDYRACLDFISQNPDIVSERQTDGLLVEAFNAQTDGKESYARLCVHQALLLQYCGKLGRDGVGLFFKRITTKDHQAGKMFIDDVNTTYQRIKTRTAELQREKSNSSTAGTEGVEQIQLHPVDPNTTIHIVVPTADSDDATTTASRAIFDSFTPDLQKALEAASLDRVNEVLAKMDVKEAEDVVQKLGEAGMLSLEEGLVDATTEDGRQRLKELEEQGCMAEGEEEKEGGGQERAGAGAGG